MEITAIVAASLLGVVAAFQIALALGAPWGGSAYGGRAPVTGGTLPVRYRVMSAAGVLLLALAAWIILARADIVGGPNDVAWPIWLVAAYLSFNTFANLASPSRIERWLWGSVSAAAAVLTVIVARLA